MTSFSDFIKWQEKREQELIDSSEELAKVQREMMRCMNFSASKFNFLVEKDSKLRRSFYLQSMKEMEALPGFREANEMYTRGFLAQAGLDSVIRKESMEGDKIHYVEIDKETGDVLCEDVYKPVHRQRR